MNRPDRMHFMYIFDFGLFVTLTLFPLLCFPLYWLVFVCTIEMCVCYAVSFYTVCMHQELPQAQEIISVFL